MLLCCSPRRRRRGCTAASETVQSQYSHCHMLEAVSLVGHYEIDVSPCGATKASRQFLSAPEDALKLSRGIMLAIQDMVP